MKLDEAERRLQRAVTDLEQVVCAKYGNGGAASPDNAEVALASARAKADELQVLNASVAERLDIAIMRVKTILENGNGAG
ncbi:MAG: hypothetical protein VX700_00665 [Pseudomonadota bacterium]|nr:hypothetical protein [Pseudomonadota bacterium]